MSENFVSISLPSKCIPYQVDPLDVEIRPYTGSDEILLSQISPENVDEKYLSVLKNVVRGIDPKILTLGDRMYLMLWEFVNSYTNSLPIDFVCSHCLNTVNVDVALDSCEVADLPDNLGDHTELSVADLPPVKVRLMTVEDIVLSRRYAEEHEDHMIYQYARTISCQDMDTGRLMEMLAGSIKLLASVREFHERFQHGPTMEYKVVCPDDGCQKEDVIDVPFRLEFLYPTGSILSAVVGA